MGGIDDNHWVDMMIDKIGFALTKVDESIQKSIELWKELTKDIYDEQPPHDTTGLPNNGKPGEEDSSVAEVKERPIQHWAMRLSEAKESPSQHWSMCASKIPESLIQEQGDDEAEEKEKEDDEGTVSESSGYQEDMCELTLGNTVMRYRPNRHHHLNEEASTALYFMRGNPYHMSTNDDDTSSKRDDESWEEDTNLETMETSYSPSGYHHRNEEDTHRITSDVTNVSLVDDVDDDLSDKLQGFVDVKEEEIENKMESGEVDTLSPECDWVYVTKE
ncbi:hypothetical protein N665_0086s0060 [Sinapis alba]|nr:hypothetical protein N665_0086s0060 [Sinapis alba]